MLLCSDLRVIGRCAYECKYILPFDLKVKGFFDIQRFPIFVNLRFSGLLSKLNIIKGGCNCDKKDIGHI